ncbi:MAG: methyltransferase domain-containing protein [Chitinophagaceae bacterium]|nr:methyltransferase domain-containing protein [Chitinophagaceae bacterium]
MRLMNLDAAFWNQRYEEGSTGWDLGTVSPVFKELLQHEPRRNIRVLIPGAGNAYEADYLLELGYQNITIADWSERVCGQLNEKYAHQPEVHIECIDFFQLQPAFDLILEQTFFCALDPSLRSAYAKKMAELLAPGGVLTGVLFDREFEGGPPFGGRASEYAELFNPLFSTEIWEPCMCSVAPRAGTELMFRIIKK